MKYLLIDDLNIGDKIWIHDYNGLSSYILDYCTKKNIRKIACTVISKDKDNKYAFVSFERKLFSEMAEMSGCSESNIIDEMNAITRRGTRNKKEIILFPGDKVVVRKDNRNGEFFYKGMEKYRGKTLKIKRQTGHLYTVTDGLWFWTQGMFTKKSMLKAMRKRNKPNLIRRILSKLNRISGV